MAIDLGLGALTYATEDGTIAKVQIAPSADTDHRAVRKLQRAMERSRQATNPDNYETVEVVRHGKKHKSLKVKSGRLQWRFSKRYESLRAELAEIFRLSVATRKREHGEVCNWLLGHAGHIIVEDNSYKEALQKPPLPSRMEQKCSVRLFLTTPECAVFFGSSRKSVERGLDF